MAEPLPLARKSLGQHWLTDQSSLETIAELAELSPTDTVLEIGPGIGSLTRVLARQAGRIVAVEIDQSLVDALTAKLNLPNLTIVHQDIQRFDLTSLPANYKVVANIPYYLTSHLIKLLSESSNPPERAVLLVQKEVAERIAAQPGEMSILAITAQFYWQVDRGLIIPARLFTPSPKVDSQVLILKYRATPLFENVDIAAFFRLVKAGFSQRRKTLVNSLSGGLHLSRNQATKLLVDSHIDPSTRAQVLSLDQWHQLYRHLTTLA